MDDNMFMLQDMIEKYYQLLESTNDNHAIKGKKISGVYLLYFPLWEVTKIIPLYVGQSTDIEKRFLTHKRIITKLFNMTSKEFERHIGDGKQDGNFLYPKIIIFLRENNLTPDDLKIKILEKNLVKPYFRILKEQWWINYYQSEIFGFNQLYFIQVAHQCSALPPNKLTLKTISNMWQTGINLIDNFDLELINFGYSYFNISNFIAFAWLQIQRVEDQAIEEVFKLPSKVIDKTLYLEFKNKLIAFTNHFNQVVPGNTANS